VTSESDPVAPRVLVVDDDGSVRDLVAFALRRAGFNAIEAVDGETALRVIEAQTIALVVLDVSMPGMSGTDVVRALRRRPETATLPVILMTGSGDDDTVVEGLTAGADDFLPKPVRLDELVARVRAHLRTDAAWSVVVEDELRVRAGVVGALTRLMLSSEPEDAAEVILAELAGRVDCDFVAVTQLALGGRLVELATYTRETGVRRGGTVLEPSLARELIAKARRGPWVETIARPESGMRSSAFAPDDVDVAVGAPIYAQDELVGLLSIGVGRGVARLSPGRQAKLLAAAIDYASVLSAIAGPSIAGVRSLAATRARLRHVLAARQFHPVFQPIVEIETGTVVGFEALTRFADGTAPSDRFAEAAEADLGSEFELAAIAAALDDSRNLPKDLFLSVNASPAVVLDGNQRFRLLVRKATRPLILELTEHVPIEDYEALRAGIGRLGFDGVAVDDAGAGYASLRHILELQPTFAKLDISLVRGIDTDELRQSLAAGLAYFALRTDCRLIAEGVESQAEADTLERLGVEFGQGYFFGRPEPLPV
jgi:EAL domain-containing protein (putative c-di-GMP-specific phosphodiesterase class I)/DNA-binding response OmpR family regulator